MKLILDKIVKVENNKNDSEMENYLNILKNEGRGFYINGTNYGVWETSNENITSEFYRDILSKFHFW